MSADNDLVIVDPAPVPAERRELMERLARGSKAEATWEAYAADWRVWEAWATANGAAPMPADPDRVAQFLADMTTSRKISTVRRYLASLSVAHTLKGHAFQRKHPAIKVIMRGAARAAPAPPRQPPQRPARIGRAPGAVDKVSCLHAHTQRCVQVPIRPPSIAPFGAASSKDENRIAAVIGALLAAPLQELLEQPLRAAGSLGAADGARARSELIDPGVVPRGQLVQAVLQRLEPLPAGHGGRPGSRPSSARDSRAPSAGSRTGRTGAGPAAPGAGSGRCPSANRRRRAPTAQRWFAPDSPWAMRFG